MATWPAVHYSYWWQWQPVKRKITARQRGVSMIRKLTQYGDTIIEVLIAITVVSAVLGGAYVTSNHSLKNSRQAQEHTIALKYAESQVELIKANSANAVAVAVGTVFCMKNDGSTSTNLPADCKPTNGIPYNVKVTRKSSNIFTVGINWDSIQGNGQDNISLLYKVSS